MNRERKHYRGIFHIVVIIVLPVYVLLGQMNLAAWNKTAAAIMALAALCGLALLMRQLNKAGQHNLELRKAAEEDKAIMMQQKIDTNIQQLHLLQSQINPHFLYNTLDTIRELALENDDRQVANIIASLSQMFRYSMDYSSTLVPLADEIRQMERFMQIQQVRFPERFTLIQHNECDDETIKNTRVPKYILQPLVENAIGHGFRTRSSGCVITITYRETDKSLEIIAQDNGVGMDDETVIKLNQEINGSESDKTIALRNINKRIKMYYGDEYGLYVTSTLGKGTTAVISLSKERL